jgi:serine protease
MFKILFFLLLCFFFHSNAQEFERGQLLVEFKVGTNIRAFIQRNSKTNLLQNKLKISEPLIPEMQYFLLEFDENIGEDKFLEFLSRDSSVKKIQLNHKVNSRSTIPNDPFFNNQWQYLNSGQSGGTIGMDIDADAAWDITEGGLTVYGDTIVIAVIDDGLNLNHPDLAPNLWKNFAEIPNNNLDDDRNGYIDDFNGWNSNSLIDDVGANGAGAHGTPVAGIIGAVGNNNLGVSGINWKIKILPIRNNFNTNEANVLRAYGYALQQRKIYNRTNGQEGAFIVATNASWGVDNGQSAQSPLWCAFYDTLGKYGILNIASTTNNSVNVDLVGDLPTTCNSNFLLSVTNLNKFGLLNGGYGSTSVDIGAFGDGIFTITFSNYGTFSGTSAAAPHVCGAVGLAYAAACPEFISLSKFHPEEAALLIKEAILNGAVPNADLTGLAQSEGQLNLYNTLQQIRQNCPIDSCFSPYQVSLDVTDSTLQFSQTGGSDSICVKLKFSGASNLLDSFVTNRADTLLTGLARCKSYELQISGFCNGLAGNFQTINFQTEGCCLFPDEVFQSSGSNFSSTVQWNAVSAANRYLLRWRPYGSQSWNLVNSNNNFYSFVNLSPCSFYELQIRTECNDTIGGYSPSFFFSTEGCNSCEDIFYCDMRGTNTDFDWIESIQIGNFQHFSGRNNGYLLFDSSFITINAGTVVPFKIFQGNDFLEYIRIWMDTNRDGDFSDNNEKIYEGTMSFVDSLSDFINIPFTNNPGITRMRIGLQWGGYPTLCTQYQNGETEDYCVLLLPGTAVYTTEDKPDIICYPNPSNGIFHLKNLPDHVYFIKLYDSNGRLIKTMDKSSLNGSETSFEIPENYSSGIYFLQIFGTDINLNIKLLRN